MKSEKNGTPEEEEGENENEDENEEGEDDGRTRTTDRHSSLQEELTALLRA